jgi:hypothetical protein
VSTAGERIPTADEVFDLVVGPPTPPSPMDRLGAACVGTVFLLVLMSTFAAALFLTGYAALWAFLGILDLLEAAR